MTSANSDEPIFFASPAEWRAWLQEHHETHTEVQVGYYKKATGRQGMTWSQAVDEALCFGWIDGVARRIDDERHQQRFTPRKKRSTWSAVNIAKVAKLTEEGRMAPAGERAFAARTEDNSGIYAFEQGHVALPPEYEERLRADVAAWAYWEARPPGYRRIATWWVISAKRPETRERRIATLVEDCAAGRLIKSQRRPGPS
jgi:uncharacterized protein YdeI (YjbR/CyaY-like superfamily)